MDFKIESSFGYGNIQALESMLQIKNIDEKESIVFDLSNYNECNPFNNLVIAQTLKNFKIEHPDLERKVIPCKNNDYDSYLQHLGFYKFFGADHGKAVGVANANSHYVPITPIEFEYEFDLYTSIEKYAMKLARLFSFDKDLYEFLKYIFVEVIRNIYEHANTKEKAYVCAQTWDRHSLVEIAIMDSGCGVSHALQRLYRDSSEQELLRMATDPGVSAKSNHRYLTKDDAWRNSGYGLYILKNLALQYGGSFMLCSNNYCDYYRNDGSIHNYKTYFPGTALAIRFKTDQNMDFNKTRARIVDQGEQEAKNISGAIKSASKSSGGHYHG